MYQAHPEVETPADDTAIWRYIDLERLLSLLHSRSLYLCRLDHLRDPWEGLWAPAMAQSFTCGTNEIEAARGKDFLKWMNGLRILAYANCWHENSGESAAFWDQYRYPGSVAIRSTVGRLKSSALSEVPFFVGRVRYLDYAEPGLSFGTMNALVPAFLKRKNFEHEREVRVLLWHPLADPESDLNTIPQSCGINVDLAILIESVYISPESPKWLIEPLVELFRRFGLAGVPVRRSGLYDKHPV